MMEQREAIEEEIAEIDDKVTELLQEEERLIEEGSWLKRNFVKLRKLVTLKKNVDQAVVRLRPKKKDDKGPSIEEQRSAINDKVTQMQRKFLDPESNKWSAEKRREMENELRNLMLEKARIRSLERMYIAKSQAVRKVELEEKELAKLEAISSLKAARPSDNADMFKPKTVANADQIPDSVRMPLTDKWTKFDRELRTAGISIPKDEITYRPLGESRSMGRRFQEAFLDDERRTVCPRSHHCASQ